jgi:hypothetical protein
MKKTKSPIRLPVILALVAKNGIMIRVLDFDHRGPSPQVIKKHYSVVPRNPSPQKMLYNAARGYFML